MKKILFLSIMLLLPIQTLAKSVEVTFSGCTDGDTAKFIMDDKIISARFLAIDTPETKHPTKGVEAYGKEASEYTCNKITNAKKITLEFDNDSEEIDKYNRYLVWVFTDGSLLQKELIEKGYAKVAYLYGDYKYTNDLQEAQKNAQANQLGIWGDYVEETDYSIYIIIGLVIIIIIACIFNKNIRTKVSKDISKKGKKEFNKAFKKLIK